VSAISDFAWIAKKATKIHKPARREACYRQKNKSLFFFNSATQMAFVFSFSKKTVCLYVQLLSKIPGIGLALIELNLFENS
jgi:hypothetical protein